jgi:hypothetical protein
MWSNTFKKRQAAEKLKQCPDFANDVGALTQLLENRGHRCLFSPVCHPELAGVCMNVSRRFV